MRNYELTPEELPRRDGAITGPLPADFRRSQIDRVSPALAYIEGDLYASTDAWSDRRIGQRTDSAWMEVGLPVGWLREPRAIGSRLLVLQHDRSTDCGELLSLQMKPYPTLDGRAGCYAVNQIVGWNGEALAVRTPTGHSSAITVGGSLARVARTTEGKDILYLPEGQRRLPPNSVVAELLFSPSGQRLLVTIRHGIHCRSLCLHQDGTTYGVPLSLPVSGGSVWLDEDHVILLVERWPARVPFEWHPATGVTRPLLATPPAGVASSLVASDGAVAFAWAGIAQPRAVCEIDRDVLRSSRPITLVTPEGSAVATTLSGVSGPLPCIIHSPGEEPVGTILMMHGGPHEVTWSEWSPLARMLLAAGWRVVQLNVRGSSLRDPVVAPGLPRRYGGDDVEDVLRVASLFPRDRLVFGGISYGAYLATRAAVMHHNPLGCILLSGFLTKQDLLFSEHVDVISFARFAFGSDFPTEDLPTTPCFIAHGTEDKRIPIEAITRHAGRLNSHSLYIQVSGEGHGIASDKAAIEVYPALLSWLAGLCYTQ